MYRPGATALRCPGPFTPYWEECLVSPGDESEALVERLLSASPTALRTMKANFLAAERTTFADYIDIEGRMRQRPRFWESE